MVSITTRWRSKASVLTAAAPAPPVPASQPSSPKKRLLPEPSSPTKRPRLVVDFNPHVEVHLMAARCEKTYDAVLLEVRLAIEQFRHGDSRAYDDLKALFSPTKTHPRKPTSTTPDEEPVPASTMRCYITALAVSVSMLDRACSDLVHAVLAAPWLGRDESFVALYTRFLGNLGSAQGGYVPAILRMLAASLGPLSSSAGRLPGCQTLRRHQLYDRAHAATKHLLRVIPSASGALSSFLTSNFPHSSESVQAHSAYTRNLIKLTEYAPELRSEVLALITDRLIKIDVQVQIDMEDLDDEDALDEVAHLPLEKQPGEVGDTLHYESDLSDAESSASEQSGEDNEASRLKEVRANVGKMDSMLDLLFEYYHPLFSTLNPIEAEMTIEMLLAQFTTTILPTYRSRHTQFLLFHFAQSSPPLVDKFAGTCLAIAFDQSRPMILRQSSAAYLASFVSRGARVPASVVRDVFELIGRQMHTIRHAQEHTCIGPDLRRYGLFYALAQCLLYIFCFRWRDLVLPTANADDDSVDGSIHDDLTALDPTHLVWLPGIKETFHRAIYSKLNPLKVCSPMIVNEFAKISNFLNFLYVFPLIETNKRLRLAHYSAPTHDAYKMPSRESALSARADESLHQLDAYFPFDPYLLPKSKKWIEGDYVKWKGIPNDKPEGDDDEDDDESEHET
ncbi:MAG: hypothetical protein M1829_001420 [Trizodia sp. TS-e1964]|nr:MAG: hypothetical protein M1829_001420 [Trizodia sp. TS-e1964]